MRDVLQLVFEYRRLFAKGEAFAGRLRPAAQDRLAALERLFGSEPEDKDTPSRRHARCAVSVPATVKVNGNVQSVQLVNIGGGGVCVSPAPNLKPGETALLRIVASDQASVFQYQVTAGWTTRSSDESQMGMPFVGTPRELSPARSRADSIY